MGALVVFDRQPGWLLHLKAYNESARLAHFLTPEYGQVLVVVRYSRRLLGKSLQSFTPALLTCTGRGELLNLRSFDQRGRQVLNHAEEKMLGMYLNELIVRLVPRGLRSRSMFAAYGTTLHSLASGSSEWEPALRLFELKLLALSGSVLPLERDCNSGKPIITERCYYHEPGKGFSLQSERGGKAAVSGQTLVALREGLQERTPAIMREAKTLLRSILDEKFRGRPLRTRGIIETLHGLRNE